MQHFHAVFKTLSVSIERFLHVYCNCAKRRGEGYNLKINSESAQIKKKYPYNKQ